MEQFLQEFVDSRGVEMRVDRQQGILRGVKLLGLDSRNGRRYLPAALEAAAGLYEAARVNVNHPKGNPLAARDYQDRLGLIRGVSLRPAAGLYGDFHFNPKHALAEQLLWDAEHAPQNVGFSHNVQARTTRQGAETLVEAILKVQSVDLVADPATTRGLFEADAGLTATMLAGGSTVAQLRAERPDLVKAIEEAAAAELWELRVEVDRLRASEATSRRRGLIRRLLAEFRLPDPETADAGGRALVSETFVETLLAAADETAIRELVAERAGLVQGAARLAWQQSPSAGRPLSREQSLGERDTALSSAESFARSLR